MQNLATFSSGSMAAYALGFLLTPIIARIYNPEAYGLFALVNSFVMNLSMISTLNYDNALLLPKTRNKFFSLIALCIGLTLFFSLAVSMLFVLVGHHILVFFNAVELEPFLFLIPLMILAHKFVQIWESWNIRLKEFRHSARSKIYSIVLSKSLVILIGLVYPLNTFGLIFGEYGSKPVMVTYLSTRKIRKSILVIVKSFSFEKVKNIANEYKNYPLFNFPGNWFSLLSNQFPVYAIGAFFALPILGHYSLAMSLLNVPVQMIGLSIGKVYFQKASETLINNKPEDLEDGFFKMLNGLLLSTLLPFSILFSFGNVIIEIVAGVSWGLAGEFVKYLAPAFMLQFIVLPLSSIFRVLRKEKTQFFLDIGGASFTIITVGLVSLLYKNEVIYVILALSTVIILHQLIYIFVMARSLNKKRAVWSISKVVFSILVSFSILYSLRVLLFS